MKWLQMFRFAVRAISESLRKEATGNNIRSTIISPGAVASELTETISGSGLKSDVAINEMIIRPTIQEL